MGSVARPRAMSWEVGAVLQYLAKQKVGEAGPRYRHRDPSAAHGTRSRYRADGRRRRSSIRIDIQREAGGEINP